MGYVYANEKKIPQTGKTADRSGCLAADETFLRRIDEYWGPESTAPNFPH